MRYNKNGEIKYTIQTSSSTGNDGTKRWIFFPNFYILSSSFHFHVFFAFNEVNSSSFFVLLYFDLGITKTRVNRARSKISLFSLLLRMSNFCIQNLYNRNDKLKINY